MEINLKKSIMKRVYAIWFVREVAPKLALISFVGFVTYRVIAYYFFVAEVAANFLTVAASNILGLPRYIATALNSAEPEALIVMAFAGTVGFLLAIKLFRSVKVLLRQGGYFSSNFTPIK